MPPDASGAAVELITWSKPTSHVMSIRRSTLITLVAAGTITAAAGVAYAISTFVLPKKRSVTGTSGEAMSKSSDFKSAADRVRTGKIGKVRQETQLLLYAYFKQANFGPCTGSRPSLLDPAGQAKYDAWKRLGEMPQAEAAAEYIALVDELTRTDGEPGISESGSDGFGSGFGAKGSTGFDVIDEGHEGEAELKDVSYWATVGDCAALKDALEQGANPNVRDDDGTCVTLH